MALKSFLLAYLCSRSRALQAGGLRTGSILILSAVAASSGSAQEFTLSARWSQYVHRTYAPYRLGRLAADTALEHALLEPGCWDYSAAAYARRYARALERRIIRNTAEFAAGALTGEDLRYRRSQSRSFSGRVWNAVRASATARMPDGTRRPAYSRFFASTVANVSTARWTRQRVQPEWLMESAASTVIDQAQTNLLDEFGPDLRRIGSRIWKRARPDRK